MATTTSAFSQSENTNAIALKKGDVKTTVKKPFGDRSVNQLRPKNEPLCQRAVKTFYPTTSFDEDLDNYETLGGFNNSIFDNVSNMVPNTRLVCSILKAFTAFDEVTPPTFKEDCNNSIDDFIPADSSFEVNEKAFGDIMLPEDFSVDVSFDMD